MKLSRRIVLMLLISLLASHGATALTVVESGQVPGLNTQLIPGVTAHNGLVYVFVKASTGARIHYVTTNANGQWSTVSMLPQGTTPGGDGIAATTFNGQVHVFYTQQASSAPRQLYYRRLLNPTTNTWSAELQVPSAQSNHRPGLSVFNNRLYVAWEVDGTSNDGIRVSNLTTSGVWSGPEQPFGTGATVLGPGAGTAHDRLYLDWGGKDSNPQLRYGFLNSVGQWLGSFNVSGSRTCCSPAAVGFDGNLVFLFKGAGTANLFYQTLNSLGSLSSPTSFATTSSGPAGTVFNNRLWAVYRGQGPTTSVRFSVLQ